MVDAHNQLVSIFLVSVGDVGIGPFIAVNREMGWGDGQDECADVVHPLYRAR
jgi:hypothetical protein